MTPYHKWLLRQRLYCEARGCMAQATKVINKYGKDYVYCDFHGYQPRKEENEWENMSPTEKDYYIGIIPPETKNNQQ